MHEYHAAYYDDEESGWIMAKVLDFPGISSQGRTLRQARRLLAAALRERIEQCREVGLAVPRPDPHSTDPTADIVEPIRPAGNPYSLWNLFWDNKPPKES